VDIKGAPEESGLDTEDLDKGFVESCNFLIDFGLG